MIQLIKAALLAVGFTFCFYACPAMAGCGPIGGTVGEVCGRAVHGVQQGFNGVASLAHGMATGNAKEIAAATGQILRNSGTGCLVCEQVATQFFPHMSEEEKNRIVGEGFLVYAATGSVVWVTINVVGNVANQNEIRDTQYNPFLDGLEQGPLIQSFSGSPECIVEAPNGKIYASWKAPIVLSDAKGPHTEGTFHISRNDIVFLTAKRICSEWTKGQPGVRPLQNARINHVEHYDSWDGSNLALIFGTPIK
jgi:hypothetical protein